MPQAQPCADQGALISELDKGLNEIASALIRLASGVETIRQAVINPPKIKDKAPPAKGGETDSAGLVAPHNDTATPATQRNQAPKRLSDALSAPVPPLAGRNAKQSGARDESTRAIRPAKKSGMSKATQEIYRACERVLEGSGADRFTLAEVAAAAKKPAHRLKYHLAKLTAAGIYDRHGKTFGTYYTRGDDLAGNAVAGMSRRTLAIYEEIAAFLKDAGRKNFTRSEAEALTGAAYSTLYHHLRKMIEAGEIKQHGAGPGAYYTMPGLDLDTPNNAETAPVKKTQKTKAERAKKAAETVKSAPPKVRAQKADGAVPAEQRKKSPFPALSPRERKALSWMISQQLDGLPITRQRLVTKSGVTSTSSVANTIFNDLEVMGHISRRKKGRSYFYTVERGLKGEDWSEIQARAIEARPSTQDWVGQAAAEIPQISPEARQVLAWILRRTMNNLGSSDTLMRKSLFLSAANRSAAVKELLDQGFIERRKGEYFAVRLADGQEYKPAGYTDPATGVRVTVCPPAPASGFMPAEKGQGSVASRAKRKAEAKKRAKAISGKGGQAGADLDIDALAAID